MLISTRLLAPCLRFLWYRLDSGSLPSMLKVHVAVIASFRSLLGGKSIGRHSLVMSFLKRARRLHPTRPPSVPPWSLGVVLRALSQLSLERLASVDMKELSLKRALLLALASAKHIGDLHMLSVDSDCIRFKPGGCSVTLRPRPVYVLNHYPPSSERRPFRFLPCLLSHWLHVMRTLRFRCAPSGLWGFTLTVRPAFGNLTSFSCAMADKRRAGPYQNRGFPTVLWTLSRLLIRAKVWNRLSH